MGIFCLNWRGSAQGFPRGEAVKTGSSEPVLTDEGCREIILVNCEYIRRIPGQTARYPSSDLALLGHLPPGGRFAGCITHQIVQFKFHKGGATLEETLAKRLGAWLICLSLGLRFLNPLGELVKNADVQAFLIYLETGRKVRFSPSLEEKSNFVGESSPPLTLYQETPALPSFAGSDSKRVSLTNMSGLKPDLEALLTRPLDWDLRSEDPTVLILHTHATESYTKSGERYTETAAFRTLSEDHNMLSIGDRVADILSRQGISVIHDRELHDYPSYNGSYSHARQSIEYYLSRYPSIQLVLDLHRDASGDNDAQLRTLAQVEGEASAQLMLVVGTDAAGLNHPNWQENMALALKLHLQLERIAPGITRPINVRSQRFNQDLSPGALLIEVGAAGNSRAEALRAAEKLAEAISQLAKGAEIQ